jgi:hypothetical protein
MSSYRIASGAGARSREANVAFEVAAKYKTMHKLPLINVTSETALSIKYLHENYLFHGKHKEDQLFSIA